eukprot:1568602-Amphidinium_carterae.1
MTEEQFTTYSQKDGYTPLYRYEGQVDATQSYWRVHSTVRHAIAMFQHCKWNINATGHGDSDEA